ncbi:death-associated inhibitor of apoptosis 1 [Drosophila innubila]|uniref:death-associated inhibitor of apoptosis 1 n=1 Tax=Drosophila innubila TaxID=198719 RepID=UPI00148E715C|nr:death-associated inhibitor of apoptosis 1 [Drosophila innubila]XP_034480536.1 death-associated inhibitor of apoptosis 1 [Drosophila innubila]
MANVATQSRYIPPCRPTATAATATIATTTTTTLIPLQDRDRDRDQVDNSTNTTQIFKSCFVNRMNDKYHREDERLRTFDSWRVAFLDKKDLALTGMFFTNQEDKVKCYFCEVEIGRWERDDHPVNEHLRWSPNCPLLRRRTTNNVPINPDALERILPPISYDICGSNDTSTLEVREHAYSEGRQRNVPTGITFAPAMQQVVSTAHTMPTMQTGPCSQRAQTHNGGNYYPEYPEYAIETARLRSFEDWPRNMKQKPQQLAEAGFFYTGVGDRVRCFSCGGGLKDWDDNDEPWEQHALWLSHCRFVKLIKGQLYIDQVAAAQAAQEQEQVKPSAAASGEEKQNSANTETSATGSSSSSTSTITSPASVTAAASVAVAPLAIPAETLQAGDVAPTAATRIFDKIVAQGCTEGALAKVSPVTTATAIPEEKLCKICYGAEYNTAFLPCGHVVACAKCASSVTKCPLCRKPFTDVMRVYFS